MNQFFQLILVCLELWRLEIRIVGIFVYSRGYLHHHVVKVIQCHPGISSVKLIKLEESCLLLRCSRNDLEPLDSSLSDVISLVETRLLRLIQFQNLLDGIGRQISES